MASHLIVRVCAIAATIGICSIATFAEPIRMSEKLSTASITGRSQPGSAFGLHQTISVSGANSVLQSKTGPTSLFATSNNTQYLVGGIDPRGPAQCGIAAVPEPSAIMLLGSGLLGAVGYRARRRSAKSR